MKKFFIIILCLVGCVPTKNLNTNIESHKNKKKLIYSVSANNIEKIIIGNNLKVRLIVGSKNKVELNNVNILQHNNGVLEISNDSSQTFKKVVVSLSKMPKLINLKGNSRVYLKAKSDSPLSLITTGSGQVIIKGWVNVEHIKNTGGADIFAHWLIGRQLKLYSKGGNIQLAGKVNHFLVELDSFAKLDSVGLKSSYVWINSSGSSLAKIMPMKSLSAKASANSQVAYYNQLPFDQIVRKVHGNANVVFVNKFDANTKIDSVVISKKNTKKNVLFN